jgi:cell division protein FtsB
MNWEHHENVKFRLKFQNEQLQAENEKLKEELQALKGETT